MNSNNLHYIRKAQEEDNFSLSWTVGVNMKLKISVKPLLKSQLCSMKVKLKKRQFTKLIYALDADFATTKSVLFWVEDW